MAQHRTEIPAANLPVRVKNELVFRHITVKSSETISGCFKRIVLNGDELTGFTSRGFDDHIKLFFPANPGDAITPPAATEEGIVWGEGPRPLNREYTPLHYDAQTNELTLDFYIHDGGVASEWAADAKPGDKLIIGGPRGSLIIPTTYKWQLYVCDETGLPAVKRRLRELKQAASDAKITVLVKVKDVSCVSYLDDEQDFNIEWIVSDEHNGYQEDDAAVKKLKSLPLPESDYYIWVTGEGKFAKGLNDYFVETRGLDANLVRCVAYWHNK
ncbi:siderophore-interacting protein [Rahnella aceris]|jgi:ferric-chelate reductase (NADPH)|uniref:siderophore-interacting protein n=1 Tax=Rahnella sp. (strain Y9602) TaxID=2703885 RepID=UPI001F53B609|nr:siderophore-interacting protein [Rahnella aceris]UNK55821.1 siderophore-interacting protein [Rahnella aceris]